MLSNIFVPFYKWVQYCLQCFHWLCTGQSECPLAMSQSHWVEFTQLGSSVPCLEISLMLRSRNEIKLSQITRLPVAWKLLRIGNARSSWIVQFIPFSLTAYCKGLEEGFLARDLWGANCDDQPFTQHIFTHLLSWKCPAGDCLYNGVCTQVFLFIASLFLAVQFWHLLLSSLIMDRAFQKADIQFQYLRSHYFH